MNDDMQKLFLAIENYIRPTTFPVAVRASREGDEAPAKARSPMKDIGHQLTLCQSVGLARRHGWTMRLAEDDHGCPMSLAILGYTSPAKLLTGELAFGTYASTREAARLMDSSNTFLPRGRIKELWLAPSNRADFDADIVLVYGNAAQIARMIQGANYKSGKGVDSKSFGRLSCSSYIARTLKEDECSLVVPSGGERVIALAQDHELIFSVPRSKFGEVAEGIELIHKSGFSRFPTPFFGLLSEPRFPEKCYDTVCRYE